MATVFSRTMTSSDPRPDLPRGYASPFCNVVSERFPLPKGEGQGEGGRCLPFSVGRQLRNLRSELGLSLRQLNEKVAVSPSHAAENRE
jgi:hypothetical protein